ncbi:MAG: hypothetical protein HZA35_01610 [Parcubacteria group bacterium]|nr:hypothetical protein [Parcubacteria group bacterium]
MRCRNALISFFIFLLVSVPCFAFTEREDFDAWLKKTHGQTSTFVEWKQLKVGTTGYCITVLKGVELSVNELEYVAVAPHPLTDIEKVLLFKIGKPLANISAVAGMSGSPVYVKHMGEWKLVGAYAYGFNALAPQGEYLAGVTPIKAMLNKNDALRSTTLRERNNDNDSLFAVKTHNEYVSGLGMCFVKSLITFTKVASGNVDVSTEAVFMNLEREPQPGDAVSVLLSQGDFTYYATGTVTYVDPLKKTFYAFGHPFLSELGIGKIEMPARRAEIATTVKSQVDSHKLPARLLEHFGTIEKDGIFAIEGSIGPKPGVLLPLSCQVTVGGITTSYSFSVVRQKVLAPILSSMGMKTLVDNVYSLETLTLGTMKTMITFGDSTSLSFNDSRIFEPRQTLSRNVLEPEEDLFSDFVRKVSLILGSEWNFDVRSIQTSFSFTPGVQRLFLDSSAVVNADGLPITSVKRGETFYVILGLRTLDNSARFTIRTPYTVPNDIYISGSTSFRMTIQSGNNYENQSFVASKHAPDSAREFLDLVRSFFAGIKNPMQLYVQIILPQDAEEETDQHIHYQGENGVWVSPPSLGNLRNKVANPPRVVQSIIDGPSQKYVLDVNAGVRLRIEK